MFEALVISLINKFLGDFVDNVKAEQLNIGLWSGASGRRRGLCALTIRVSL